MQITWIRVVQSLQALFAIIELGLMSYVVDWYNGAPSRPTFLLFTSIWTLIIALPFLILAPKYAPQIGQPIVLLSIEFITMIFWFAGFVALAAMISGWAGSTVVYRMRAGVAFGAFDWFLYMISLIFVALPMVRGPRLGGSAPPLGIHSRPNV